MKKLVVVLALGLIALNVMSYRHAGKMLVFVETGERTLPPEAMSLIEKMHTLFSGVSIPRPTTSLPVSALSAHARELSLTTPDGFTLGAWLAEGKASAPAAVLFHGYSAEKSSLLAEAGAFLAWGYSVLLVDFRGSGDSSAAHTTLGIHEAIDVAVAVDYLREQLSPSVIVVYGQSMGAAAVLRAVHLGKIDPDVLILESVFDRLETTVAHRFRAMGLPAYPLATFLLGWGGVRMNVEVFDHNPVDYARSVSCPVIVLHGSEDPRVTVDEARHVYAALPGKKSLTVFPGARHQSLLAYDEGAWRSALSYGRLLP